MENEKSEFFQIVTFSKDTAISIVQLAMPNIWHVNYRLKSLLLVVDTWWHVSQLPLDLLAKIILGTLLIYLKGKAQLHCTENQNIKLRRMIWSKFGPNKL